MACCTWLWGTELLAGPPPDGTHGAQVHVHTEALGQRLGWVGMAMGMGTGMGMETGLPQAGLTVLAQHQHPGTAGTQAQVSPRKCQFLPCAGACN